jgi:multidrug efflux pump subunit AcrA (membrane-fusion protein)
VEELNRDISVSVTRIGARIDPVNQTVLLVGEVVGKVDNLLPGMSGWAIFIPPAAK